MLLNEIFNNDKSTLNEWGYRGFGGYGRGFFRRNHYAAVANACHRKLPEAVKGQVEKWFVNAFERDNHTFKPDAFLKACQNGIRETSYPKWEMRHFYYLAECVKGISSEHMREFVATFLADFLKREPGNFNSDRWYSYCGIADPDSEDARQG